MLRVSHSALLSTCLVKLLVRGVCAHQRVVVAGNDPGHTARHTVSVMRHLVTMDWSSSQRLQSDFTMASRCGQCSAGHSAASTTGRTLHAAPRAERQINAVESLM